MIRKKVIINADDYGLTAGVSYGILESNLNGIVTSTTALPVSEHFEEAMALSKHFPNLKIGIHLGLTLKKTKPLLGDKVPSLIQEDGNFHSNGDILAHVDLNEVEMEWRAQMDKFLSTGYFPTHIDSHHNVHCHSFELFDIAKSLAKEYDIPLRNHLDMQDAAKYNQAIEDIKTTEKCDQRFYGEDNISLKKLDSIFSSIAQSEGSVFEVNCHPGFIDLSLMDKSSYTEARLKELDLLRSDEVKNLVEKYNLELTTFDQI